MVTYKYNVGDYVRFKDKFSSPSTGLVGREGTIAKITGIAPSYNNKPHYYLDNNICGAYRESCFAGLATESEFHAQCSLDSKIDTDRGHETKCDTDDSGAFWTFEIPGYAKCSSCGRSFEALPTEFMFKENNKFCRMCGKAMEVRDEN